MTVFAIVEAATGVLDQGSDWTPEDGHEIVEESRSALEIGGIYLTASIRRRFIPNQLRKNWRSEMV